MHDECPDNSGKLKLLRLIKEIPKQVVDTKHSGFEGENLGLKILDMILKFQNNRN